MKLRLGCRTALLAARVSELSPRLVGAAIFGIGFAALIAQLIPGA